METVVVTGASRGIGAEAAVRLSKPDRRLVLLARSPCGLRDTAHRCRGPVITLSADLSAADAPEQVLGALRQRGVDPNGWVLNAGVANGGAFGASDPGAVEREFRLNYLTPLGLLRHEIPRLRNRVDARVIVVASLTSVVPFPGNATYAASKAALFSLVRSLRVELRDSAMHLGAVLPGYTRTSMTEGHSSRWIQPMSAAAVGQRVATSFENRTALAIPGMMNQLAAKVFGRFPILSEHLLKVPGLVVSATHDA